MLDARETCSGATGRNGGHIKCTPFEAYHESKKRFGAAAAKKITEFQTSHLKILVDLAKREKWPLAEAREVETLDVFYDAEEFEEWKDMVAEFRTDCPDDARGIEIWEAEIAREKWKVGPHALGAMSYTAGAIWPYRFVVSCLDSLLKQYPEQFSIDSYTAVEEISVTRNPERPYVVHTSRGDVLARHVIHATNAHTANLVPGLRGKLFPVRGTMSAQRPGKGFPDLKGDRSWCLINEHGYEYITQRPGKVDSVDSMGGEIMNGGAMVQSGHKGLGEFGIASDAATNYLASCHLSGVLPMAFGAENWGADADGGRVKSIWSGSLGLTADMMPFVGRLETSLTGRVPVRSDSSNRSTTKPGEWVSAGYNGEGMVNAYLCGVALGLMAVGREDAVQFTSKTPGIPNGRLEDWFVPEYLCTQERVTYASVYQLLESR